MGTKIKAGAIVAGWGFLILIGWLAIMLAYFAIYSELERDAAPVNLPLRVFSTEMWDQGFFHASGAFKNDSAATEGDELITQANDITCSKSANLCTVATADVYDRYLNLDVTPYEIGSWTDRQITLEDVTPICVTQTIIIDRTAQTFSMIVRKKAVIPDYAQKSSLRPCESSVDKNISLADGFHVSQQKRERFEQRNGLKLHALLFAMNTAYFGAVWLWFRRRKARRSAAMIA